MLEVGEGMRVDMANARHCACMGMSPRIPSVLQLICVDNYNNEKRKLMGGKSNHQSIKNPRPVIHFKW